MARVRSITVVALLWVAALAGSSAPDGFGGSRRAEMPVLAGAAAHSARHAVLFEATRSGKGWATTSNPIGKRWEIGNSPIGKRWWMG